MKKLLLTLFVLISATMFSQVINEDLTEKAWLDDDAKTIFGNKVTMIFGEPAGRQATINSAPVTTVAYKTTEQLVEKTKKLAEKENWSEEKTKDEIEIIEKEAPGGRLYIYITRENEGRANAKWFFVIFRDLKDKGKITEIDLPYQAAQLPQGKGWWNFIEVNIDKPLPSSFYAYLNDRQSDQLSDFKFLINKGK